MAEQVSTVDPQVPPQWDSFAKRLRWAVAHGKRVGAIKSGEDWSLRAGRARQYIDTAIARGGGLNLVEAASLVDVPGMEFDLYWLATGKGDPRLGRHMQRDAWHERLRGAEIAMTKHGVPPEVVESIRRDPKWNNPKLREKRSTFWKNVFVAADQARLRLVVQREHAPPASERKLDAG